MIYLADAVPMPIDLFDDAATTLGGARGSGLSPLSECGKCSNALIACHCPHVSSRVGRLDGAGSNLRPKVPYLFADLRQGQQLHWLPIHIDGSVPNVRMGHRSPVHRQSVLPTQKSTQ